MNFISGRWKVNFGGPVDSSEAAKAAMVEAEKENKELTLLLRQAKLGNRELAAVRDAYGSVERLAETLKTSTGMYHLSVTLRDAKGCARRQTTRASLIKIAGALWEAGYIKPEEMASYGL